MPHCTTGTAAHMPEGGFLCRTMHLFGPQRAGARADEGGQLALHCYALQTMLHTTCKDSDRAMQTVCMYMTQHSSPVCTCCAHAMFNMNTADVRMLDHLEAVGCNNGAAALGTLVRIFLRVHQ